MASSYTDRLRRLALNAPDLEDDAGLLESRTDRKSLALARVAALVAIGGAESSFDELVDTAMSEGASADEIVDMLITLGPIVGLPRVVEAAPKLALALGYDIGSDVS
jgi:4-carboxymuconolactone decarboxylase